MSSRIASALVCWCCLVAWAATAHADPSLGEASPIALGDVAVPNTVNHPFQLTEPDIVADDHVDLDTTGCPVGFSFDRTDDIEITSLAPADLTVSYHATARTSAQTCTVDVLDHGTTTVLLTFEVDAKGVGPALAAPASLTFAPTRVTTGAVATQLLTLTNDGDAGQSLQITALAFGAMSPFSVSAGPALPVTLASGASATFTLQYAPTAAGTQTDTLSITSTAVGATTTHVALTGTGTNAVISASDVAFGTVLDSGAGSTKSITISNTGALPIGVLAVTSATLDDASGWFAFASSTGCTGTTCALALAISGTPATFGVTCKPTPLTATGTQMATVTFASDSDPGGKSTATLSCTAGRPDLALGPPAPTLAFGDVAIGGSSAISFTVHNGGTSPLTYSFAQPGAPYSVTSGACGPCTIAAGGADQTITVQFAPTAQGAATGTLTLTTNDPDPGNHSIAISLDGNGTGSQITGAPSTLAFGNVDAGKTRTAQLTIGNSGNLPLHVTSATLAGGAYAVVTGGTGPQTIAPGGTASWTLQCAPATKGAQPGTFTIASDSETNPSAVVTLTCTGLVGQLAVTPNPFDFGGVREGDIATKTFVVTNGGNTPVSGITAVLADGTLGYSITSGPPATLAAGASGNLVVQFAPTGPSSGGMDAITVAGVWGSAPATPVSTTLQVSGADRAAGYDVSPTLLAFGDVRWDQTATQTFDIQLTEDAPVTITAITIAPDSGTTTGEISRVSLKKNGATTTLPVTLSSLTDVVTVGIKVDPANRLGVVSGTVTVVSDLAMNPTRTVAVTADSVTPELTLSPASAVLDFGQVDVAGGPVTMPVTLTNTGSGSLSVGSIGTADPQDAYTFDLPSTPATIGPGATATIQVTFDPSVAGTDAATITIPLSGIFGDSSPTQTIAVTGQGIDRRIVLPATMVTFPPTFRYPTTPPQLAVHVANAGLAPLHVSMAEVTGSSAFTLAGAGSGSGGGSGAGSTTIAGSGSADFLVAFDPHELGTLTGELVLSDDDTQTPMAHVQLMGTGIARDVAFDPPTVNAGVIGIGLPRKLSDIAPADSLALTNLDGSATFHVKLVSITGSDVALLDPPEDVDLAPMRTFPFDVEIAPTQEGPFTATVSLYLDEDPDVTGTIAITGTGVFAEADGGGGCAVGGGGGGRGAWLVAAALGAVLAGGRRRRRSRRVAGAAAVALLGASAGVAAADPSRELDATVFHPTPSTTDGGFAVQSATVGEHGDYALSALLSYADKPVDLAAGGTHDYMVSTRGLIDLGGALALRGRFEVSAHMPLYAQSGDAMSGSLLGQQPASGAAAGDLVLGGKAWLWRRPDRIVQVGAAASLSVPTATGDFIGTRYPEGRLLALATVTPPQLGGRLAVHVDAGAVIRGTQTFANVDEKSGFAWGLGGTYRVLDPLWVEAELYGELVPGGVRTGPAMDGAAAPTQALDTVEVLVGARYQLDRRTQLGAAIGRGLDDGFGSPAVRAIVSATFVPGARARPPLRERIDVAAMGTAPSVTPEVPVAPPPAVDATLDTDHDGIPDVRDKCPTEPETINGNADDDGCPDAGEPLVIAAADRLEMLDTVTWKDNELDKASFNVLGQVAATLRAHAEIRKLRIAVHVQPTKNVERDRRMSQQRAAVLRQWLIDAGVSPARVEAVGNGGSQPLVPASQKGSAMINERIELIVVDRAPLR